MKLKKGNVRASTEIVAKFYSNRLAKISELEVMKKRNDFHHEMEQPIK